MKSIVAVGLGGAIGSVLRFGASMWITRSSAAQFPWPTFFVNVAGCFLIGVLFSLGEKYDWFSNDMRLFLITGICGGFTTFSAFAFENWKMLQEGHTLLFFGYISATLLATLMAVAAGVWLCRMMV